MNRHNNLGRVVCCHYTNRAWNGCVDYSGQSVTGDQAIDLDIRLLSVFYRHALLELAMGLEPTENLSITNAALSRLSYTSVVAPQVSYARSAVAKP